MLTEGILQSIENKNINLKNIVFKYICETDDKIPFLEPHLKYFMDYYDWYEISQFIHDKKYDATHTFIQKFKDNLNPALNAYMKYAMDEKDVPDSISNRMFVMEEEDFNEDNINETLLYQEIPVSVLHKYSKIIHWGMVSKYQNLSEDSIDLFADKLNWADISEYRTLSESFIENHAERVDWKQILKNQNISEAFLEKNKDIITHRKISLFKKDLSEQFIRTHVNNLFMKSISSTNILSIKFIDEFFSLLDHKLVCKYQTLNDYIIIKYKNVFDWNDIGMYQINNLSLDLIEDNFHKFDWNYITRKVSLREDIIERFLHLLDSYKFNISAHQKLSIEFINKYKIFLHWPSLLARQKLTEDIIDSNYEFIIKSTKILDYWGYNVHGFDCWYSLERIVWSIICRHQVLSEEFIIKHINRVEMAIIFEYQKLSEKFILRYYRRASAYDVLYNCNNLSVSCIEEILKNGYNWTVACQRQKLPEDFLQKHINKFKYNDVLRYQKLSEEFIDFNIKRIRTKCLGWDTLARYQSLSFGFVKRYSKYLNLDILREYQHHLHITSSVESKLCFRKKSTSLLASTDDILGN